MRLALLTILLASTAAADPAHSTVHFAEGSTRVPAAAHDAIAASARAQSGANGVLIVEGYASTSGSRAQNLRLSQRRTEAVRSALLAAGADPHRIVMVAHGEEHPDRAGAAAPVVVIRSDSFAVPQPPTVQARTSPARTRRAGESTASTAPRPQAAPEPAPTVVVVVPPTPPANNTLTTRALWEPLAPVFIAPSSTSATLWPAGDLHGGTIGNATVSPPGAAIGPATAEAAPSKP